MPLTVYILKCKDDSYYTGITNDIDRRIWEHNEGINEDAYTYSRRPVVLLYQEDFEDYKDAYTFERQIKGWSRKKKEALISGNFSNLEKLSKRKKK